LDQRRSSDQNPRGCTSPSHGAPTHFEKPGEPDVPAADPGRRHQHHHNNNQPEDHEDAIDEDEVSGAGGTLGGYLPIRRAAPKIIDCGGVVARCSKCGLPLEHFSDEDLALAVLVLTTFVRREPALAAPNLPEIIVTIARS
jgi:hypothetical protein